MPSGRGAGPLRFHRFPAVLHEWQAAREKPITGDPRQGDSHTSRILNTFLSIEVNRNLSHVISLAENQLTKIAIEIYQFKWLQRIDLNKITSIASSRIFGNYYSSTKRLIRLKLNDNQISHIETGAFDGLAHRFGQ